MRFADFPFLRYLPFILIGILWSQSNWSLDLVALSMALGVCWLGYLSLVSSQGHPKSTVKLSFLAYLALIFFGALLVQNKQHQTDFTTDIRQVESYLAEVTLYDQQKPHSFENLLEVKSVLTKGKWDDAQGKVLVYHQNEKPLEPGQILLVKKNPEEIAGPVNPNEFDYMLYLSRQGIRYRQFLGKDFHVVDSVSHNGFNYFLVHLRHRIGGMLKAKIPDENSAQIALALLLGQKKELDPTIREAYTQAGVMHILAVSGLHVGIIYALFILILKPLKLKKEKARLYLLSVILVIWLYAFLTGLSPSVVRASTMFSLLTLGQMRERRPSIYNILAFSAILMITTNPDVVFEVGFQLSYLAVLGIVMIQPLILNLWLPQYKALEYIWQLTSVSIAAQLVTFPLSIYYFHVFPTYFLLGNLLILPLAFLIMQVGVPLMIFGWIPMLGDGLGWILSWLIWGQNWIAETIRLIPGGKMDRLTMDFSGMIFVWGMLLILVGWEVGSKRKLTWLALTLAFLWTGFQLYGEVQNTTKELIVYQGKKSQILDFSDSGAVYSWNQGLEPGEISYSVDPNRIQNHWPQIPESFNAFLKGSGEIGFIGTDFTFDPKDKKLHFLSTPKSVHFWSSGKWIDQPISDSLVVDSLAYRIVF
ncbi:ComEC/Rec2 family competence protein [Algoriphagus persicinus]|uniref:ComEC/Rec2 family competence protein n=1 Tax=Algoriphagus persicinus TaxID=3108754 RepID=UPI002B3B3040|nr:ComEC/Rec2 family competence protein [Algoriphagus sp. E1-3-M2]MEB2784868.1 ComEC/Rec2 family competence protein [Algoriphagus sp. E1-3-M2]